MRNVYSHKNPCFRIQQTLRKHFLPPAGCGNILPAKSGRDAWRSDSRLVRDQVNTANEAKLGPQFVKLLKCWLCTAMEKNWAHSVDQCRLHVLQFSAHLINLLSTLLRCNGFTGIQKAVEDQTGSRPPDCDQDLFFGTSLVSGNALGFYLVQPLSWTSPVVVQNPLFIARHGPTEKWFIVAQ